MYSTVLALLFLSTAQVQSRTLNINTDPDCEIQQYWPDIYNCSRFYECDSAGEKNMRECAPGTVWSPDKETCDLPTNVDCSWTRAPTIVSTISTSTTTTTEATTTTTEATTTTTTEATTTTTPAPITTPSHECTYENQYFPYPYDCSKYYECTDYKATLMDCPDGEYWNDQKETCDWPWNVDCVASSTPSDYANTPKISHRKSEEKKEFL